MLSRAQGVISGKVPVATDCSATFTRPGPIGTSFLPGAGNGA